MADQEPTSWQESFAITAIVLMIIALALTCLFGCSTCLPDHCADCPVEIVTIPSPPEVITILPPKMSVPPMPILECVENANLAILDPASWLVLLAADFVELKEALETMRTKQILINETR